MHMNMHSLLIHRKLLSHMCKIKMITDGPWVFGFVFSLSGRHWESELLHYRTTASSHITKMLE